MILNEFVYKYPHLQLLNDYRLSYVAITNSVTAFQPIFQQQKDIKNENVHNFCFRKYCKTPFTELLILTKRQWYSQLFKISPIKRETRMMRRSFTASKGREFIGFDTFYLGVIFQYDEQHTKVSVEMKVIYLGLESHGKHHCQSLFRFVRYFSS